MRTALRRALPALLIILPTFGVEPGELDAKPAKTWQAVRTIILGSWRGSYTCPQGRTGVELSFTELKSGGAIRGTFRFFPISGGNAKPGKYEISGTYNRDDDTLLMIPGDWIEQPEGYVTVGFLASVRPREGKLSGRIAFPSCGEIEATKDVVVQLKSRTQS